MLTTSVIILLREALEAALLISILWALSRIFHLPSRWLMLAVAVGLGGSILLARWMAPLSELLDGTGQEVLDGGLQLLISLLIATIIYLVASSPAQRDLHRPPDHHWLAAIMALAVCLAVVREGSEIIIFLKGFLAVPGHRDSVVIGSVIGLGIGVSAGIITTYLLLSIPSRRVLYVAILLLTLMSAGLALQGSNLLIQADLLPYQPPVWDTSTLISEQGVPGQLLYALLGYEATPTAWQLVFYAATLALCLGGWLLGIRQARQYWEAQP